MDTAVKALLRGRGRKERCLERSTTETKGKIGVVSSRLQPQFGWGNNRGKENEIEGKEVVVG